MTAIPGLLTVTILGTVPIGPGDHSRTVSVGGLERRYLVHVPARYDSRKPAAVVLAFHGGGANADNMIVFSGLNKKPDEAGFIVVYPSGTGRHDVGVLPETPDEIAAPTPKSRLGMNAPERIESARLVRILTRMISTSETSATRRRYEAWL